MGHTEKLAKEYSKTGVCVLIDPPTTYQVALVCSYKWFINTQTLSNKHQKLNYIKTFTTGSKWHMDLI